MVMIIPDLCQNGVVTKVRTTSSRDNKNTHQRIAGMPLQILIQRARSTRQICRGAYLCDLDVHVARGALPSQTFVGTQFGIPVSIIEFGPPSAMVKPELCLTFSRIREFENSHSDEFSWYGKWQKKASFLGKLFD